MIRAFYAALTWLAVGQLLAGCAATGDATAISDYEYREGDRAVREAEFRKQCEARGGYVYTEGTSSSRIASAKHRSSRTECAMRRRGSIVRSPGG